MINFFAGQDNNPRYNKILQKNGVGSRLESFAYMRTKIPRVSEWDNYLLDSGGLSARNSGVDIDRTDLANYINRYEIKFAFNLDDIDFEKTKQNLVFLQNECPNTYIIPILNMEFLSHTNYFHELTSDHPYIGLGGVAGVQHTEPELFYFWGQVFKRTRDNVRVHGLGCSSKKYMGLFPWYSTDSTAWLSLARYGASSSGRISKRLTNAMNRKNHYLENLDQDIEKYWSKLESYATELWSARGITWQQLRN